MPLEEKPVAPQRIAFLLPNLEAGGAERVAITLASSLVERGHQVDFVLAQVTGALVEEVPAGARIFDLGVTQFRNLLSPLENYLKSERPRSMLVFMWPLTTLSVIARWRAKTNTRLIISDHVVLTRHYPSWRHKLMLMATMTPSYRFADRRIVVSRGVAENSAALSLLPRDRFKVIYNPVSRPKLPLKEENDWIWNVPRGSRILSVGTLKSQKNYPLLLQAFAELPDENARLIIVGEGPQRSSLEELASGPKLKGRVILAGHQDPAPYYRSADLFVLPSDYEGFALVVAEALSYGLKVVSTDCPSGPAEILAGGKFGTLVPVGDQEALTQAIQKALASPSDPDVLRARAEDFDPEKICHLYEEALLQ